MFDVKNQHSEFRKVLKLKKKGETVVYNIYVTGISGGLMESVQREQVRWKINYNIKSVKECNLFGRWFCDVIKCVASACIKSVQCPDLKSGI